MIWLEMSHDHDHGGFGWEFTKCLWSPSHKNPSGSWPFWNSLLKTKENDIVIHLRGTSHKRFFVSYSIADVDGYETDNRPPKPKDWNFARSYIRVPLKDFVPFIEPISLDEVFKINEQELRDYFISNKKRSRLEKELLFYVIQSDRLQCLNGAYCSHVSPVLARIIFGPDFSYDRIRVQPVSIVLTGQQITQIATRIGQKEFSDNVCDNYKNQCCFPECEVNEEQFLLGAHIARWSDVLELRGQIANGLCLCLMHDKAFEKGLFTLNLDFKICINHDEIRNSKWAQFHLTPYGGFKIRVGSIKPSEEALKHHWQRIKFTPEIQ